MLTITKEAAAITYLMTATDYELNSFNQAVQKNQGIVPILVHPFFTGDSDADYCQKRDKYISSCLGHGLPLVIFEEYLEIPNLDRHLPIYTSPIYIVTTELSDPQPYHPLFIDNEASWHQLFNILGKAGAKRLIVGGEYLNFYYTNQIPKKPMHEPLRDFYSQISSISKSLPPTIEQIRQKEVVPWGCVGLSLVRLFLAGFDVRLSSVASPGTIL